MCPPDPSTWTVDSSLTLAGVIVSGLGALATIVIAIFALRQTIRTDALVRADSERAGRARMAEIIDRYLNAWPRLRYRNGQPESIAAQQALQRAAAGVSPDAGHLVVWLLGALNAADLLIPFKDDTNSATSPKKTTPPKYLVAYVCIQARSRVSQWVATGALDESPLMTRDD